MATKPFVTVSLELHMENGEPLEIADYVDDNGRFVPIGTQAAKALEMREQIHTVLSDGTEVIVPFHSIVASAVTKSEEEYTPAEDTFCVADPCVAENNCNTSWTISFYNGETLLQQSIFANGATPSYNGVTPTKPDDAENTYTFIGWNTSADAETALEAIPAAEAVASYYAIFEATPKGD